MSGHLLLPWLDQDRPFITPAIDPSYEDIPVSRGLNVTRKG